MPTLAHDHLTSWLTSCGTRTPAHALRWHRDVSIDFICESKLFLILFDNTQMTDTECMHEVSLSFRYMVDALRNIAPLVGRESCSH